MSYELWQDKHQFPAPYAATLLIPRQPVTLVGTNSLLAAPVGTANVRVDGVTNTATFTAGENVVALFSQNVVKMRAAASLGVGADVIVGSTNGRVIAGGIAASGHWVIGQSLTTAADGEIVSVFVNPRKA